MIRTISAITALCIFAAPAFAWSEIERIDLADALGTVLAAEKFCGLKYKQDAIKNFIDAKVPADDMKFAGSLKGHVSLTKYSHKEMSESEKSAHCRQIERVAKSYGFI